MLHPDNLPISIKKNSGDIFLNGNSPEDWFLGNIVSIRGIISSNISKANIYNPFKNQGIFKDSNYESKFDITGAVKLSEEAFNKQLEDDEVLYEFFSKKGRVARKKGNNTEEVLLSGYRQVVALDRSLRISQILKIFYEDIREGLSIIEKIENRNIEVTDENMLFYFSILQSTKNAILTVFNALIVKEKQGQFQNGNGKYQEYRLCIEHFLLEIIEQSYKLLLGEDIKSERNKVVNYTNSLDEIYLYLQDNADFSHFSRPESTHPLSMMGSTFLIAKNNPSINTIVSMPSGGTELAIIQRLAYKEIYDNAPDILILPISLHSIKNLGGGDIHGSSLDEYLENKIALIKGKKILIVDDNSSSGSTLEAANNIIQSMEAEQIISRVSEADLIRTKANLENEKKGIANPIIYADACQILPVSRSIQKKCDLKSLKELKIIGKYYDENIDGKSDIERIQHDILLGNLQKPDFFRDKIHKNKNISFFQKTPLSNFSLAMVCLDENIYPSVEHAYMASKFKSGESVSSQLEDESKEKVFYLINGLLKERVASYTVDSQNIDDIFLSSELTAGDIKSITNLLSQHIPIRNDWDEVRLPTMIDLLLQKFRNDNTHREYLIKTGDSILIEGNDWSDTYWGVDSQTGLGNNFLGRILMEIRDKYM